MVPPKRREVPSDRRERQTLLRNLRGQVSGSSISLADGANRLVRSNDAHRVFFSQNRVVGLRRDGVQGNIETIRWTAGLVDASDAGGAAAFASKTGFEMLRR